MKDLLVASVFCNNPQDNNKRQAQWYALQQRFLAKTTENFDHVVWLNGFDEVRYPFDQANIIGSFPDNKWEPHKIIKDMSSKKTAHFCPHTFALEEIVKHFKQTDYKNYLILDNDCFPIKKGWLDLLLEKMGDRYFAAPIRFENLDTFPHPSTLFFKGKDALETTLALQPSSFMPVTWTNNLLEEGVADTCSDWSLYKCFPLIRTNTYNIHPIFCGVYYNMFYHHGCGSTIKKTRVTESYYGRSLIDDTKLEIEWFNQLMKFPERFICSLTKL